MSAVGIEKRDLQVDIQIVPVVIRIVPVLDLRSRTGTKVDKIDDLVHLSVATCKR